MKIDVLGYSNSVQTGESGNTSLVVSSAGTAVLVDVSGSPCRELIFRGIDPDTFGHLVITHGHADHSYAFPSLMHDLRQRKRVKELTVSGNAHALSILKKLLAIYDLESKAGATPIQWQQIEAGTAIEADDIKITAFEVFHNQAVPTLGYVFESQGKKISYFPDSCAREPYPLCAQNADIVFHEAGGLRAEEAALKKVGHSSGRQAAMLAKSLAAKKLVLAHLPPDPNMVRGILKEAQEVFPAAELPALSYTIQ